MFFKLLLLFTVVPAIELYLLIWLGQHIGAGLTVLIIIATGAIGAALAKREGLGVLRSIQEETLRGVPPGDRLIEGVLVLVGGVLLITPGVLSDLTGIFPSRGEARRTVKENALSINKEKVGEDKVVGVGDLLNGKYILVQKGKKNYFLVIAN